MTDTKKAPPMINAYVYAGKLSDLIATGTLSEEQITDIRDYALAGDPDLYVQALDDTKLSEFYFADSLYYCWHCGQKIYPEPFILLERLSYGFDYEEHFCIQCATAVALEMTHALNTLIMMEDITITPTLHPRPRPTPIPPPLPEEEDEDEEEDEEGED